MSLGAGAMLLSVGRPGLSRGTMSDLDAGRAVWVATVNQVSVAACDSSHGSTGVLNRPGP
jgi:hypothetical protein